MSLTLLVVIWLVSIVVVGAIAWAMARAAAAGDRDELERLQAEGGEFRDRRVGPPERRATARPEAPGRRREDLLRAELVRAQEELSDAQARVVDAEARLELERSEPEGTA